MKLEHTLSIKQSQGLSLTPQMQQSLRLLQMSTVELTEFVANELLNNPFLLQPEQDILHERVEHHHDRDPDLAILQEQEYSNFWTDVSNQPSYERTHQEWFENLAPIRLNLRQHLTVQLHLSTPDPHIRLIGEALIDGLDEDGYIRLDLHKFAHDLGEPYSKVVSALKLLQSFEPVGVCAQNLVQCFEIQLKDSGHLSPSMRILLNHLDIVLSRGWEGIAKQCKLPYEHVEDMVRILRTLNPKPGLTFDPDPIETLIPDLIMRQNEQGHIWVELNEEAQPRVLANQGYYHEINKRIRTKDEKSYVNQNYQQATWLEKALKQRYETMLKVANAIVTNQREYFLGRQGFLRPMTLKDLALDLNLHESTVSRATMNKFMTTPRGIKELREFFTHSVNGDEDLSAHHVQERIRSLISKELAIKPLSDDQLVHLLYKEGIEVARRTVTKYREGMKIPSSYERKRQARLMTF